MKGERGVTERSLGTQEVRAGQWKEEDKLRALLKDAEANRSLAGPGDRRKARRRGREKGKLKKLLFPRKSN